MEVINAIDSVIYNLENAFKLETKLYDQYLKNILEDIEIQIYDIEGPKKVEMDVPHSPENKKIIIRLFEHGISKYSAKSSISSKKLTDQIIKEISLRIFSDIEEQQPKIIEEWKAAIILDNDIGVKSTEDFNFKSYDTLTDLKEYIKLFITNPVAKEYVQRYDTIVEILGEINKTNLTNDAIISDGLLRYSTIEELEKEIEIFNSLFNWPKTFSDFDKKMFVDSMINKTPGFLYDEMNSKILKELFNFEENVVSKLSEKIKRDMIVNKKNFSLYDINRLNIMEFAKRNNIEIPTFMGSRFQQISKKSFEKFQEIIGIYKENLNIRIYIKSYVKSYFDIVSIDFVKNELKGYIEAKTKDELSNMTKNVGKTFYYKDKWGQHVASHPDYVQGKSIITISYSDAIDLIKQYAGTGIMVFNSDGTWASQEIIFSNTIVGNVNGMPTRAFKIHYGLNGIHIVPLYSYNLSNIRFENQTEQTLNPATNTKINKSVPHEGIRHQTMKQSNYTKIGSSDIFVEEKTNGIQDIEMIDESYQAKIVEGPIEQRQFQDNRALLNDFAIEKITISPSQLDSILEKLKIGKKPFLEKLDTVIDRNLSDISKYIVENNLNQEESELLIEKTYLRLAEKYWGNKEIMKKLETIIPKEGNSLRETIGNIASRVSEIELKLYEKYAEINERVVVSNVPVRLIGNSKILLPLRLKEFENEISRMPKKLKEILKNVEIKIYDIECFESSSASIDYFGKTRKLFKICAGTIGNEIRIYEHGISIYSGLPSIEYETIVHELGHIIDSKVGNISEKQEWSAAIVEDEKMNNKKSVSSYGETSLKEDFAESIKLYYRNRDYFRENFPNRFKLLEELNNNNNKILNNNIVNNSQDFFRKNLNQSKNEYEINFKIKQLLKECEKIKSEIDKIKLDNSIDNKMQKKLYKFEEELALKQHILIEQIESTFLNIFEIISTENEQLINAYIEMKYEIKSNSIEYEKFLEILLGVNNSYKKYLLNNSIFDAMLLTYKDLINMTHDFQNGYDIKSNINLTINKMLISLRNNMLDALCKKANIKEIYETHETQLIKYFIEKFLNTLNVKSIREIEFFAEYMFTIFEEYKNNSDLNTFHDFFSKEDINKFLSILFVSPNVDKYSNICLDLILNSTKLNIMNINAWDIEDVQNYMTIQKNIILKYSKYFNKINYNEILKQIDIVNDYARRKKIIISSKQAINTNSIKSIIENSSEIKEETIILSNESTKRLLEIYGNERIGANQGIIRNILDSGDKASINRLIRVVKNNYPNLSYKSIIEFLKLIEGAGNMGVCNYAIVVNAILESNIDRSILEEKLGYKLFENGKANDDLLLADLFTTLNPHLIGKENNLEYINLASTKEDSNALNVETINKFFEIKGIPIIVETENLLNDVIKTFPIDKQRNYIINMILQAINTGASPSISLDYGATMYSTDLDKEVLDGAHIMTIFGINDFYDLRVDSWGEEFIIEILPLLEKSKILSINTLKLKQK